MTFPDNTIDIDEFDKEQLERILAKVRSMPCAEKVDVDPSMRGTHIIIQCTFWENCDMCRLAFDDQFRFAADQTRPLNTRNILWTKKCYRSLRY